MRIHQILEDASGHEGGNAKKFEDDLITLAKLTSLPENKNKPVATVYDENVDKMTAQPKTRDDAIESIKALNKKFPDQVWTDGYNSNFALADAPEPNYGIKSAKCDIVLNDLPMSVKLSGAFVVASAQNKEEFSGIFNSALDFYIQEKGAELAFGEEIDQFKAVITEASEKYIGEVKQRVQKSDRYKKILSKFQDAMDIHDELEKHMNEVEGKMVDEYAAATKELKQNILKKIQTILKGNNELKQYVVWEALSSSLKYDYQLPYATWVISPSGVANISSVDQPYVAKCARASKFDIRGLPTGPIRSGSSAFVTNQTNAYRKGSVDIAGIMKNIDKMAFGMKIDVTAKAAKSLKIDESIDVKEVMKKIFDWIQSWFKSMVDAVRGILSKINDLKSASITDWTQALGIEPVGEIVMP